MLCNRSSKRLLCLLLSATLAACGGTTGRDDRGDDSSSGSKDAGKTPKDGGSSDTDAGEADAGVEEDGGVVTHLPSAQVETPTGMGGDIHVQYRLFDENSAPISIDVKWSDDGATWRNATVSSQTTELTSSPEGVQHELVWLSGTDAASRQLNVRLRLTPSNATDTGKPVQTNEFPIDNRRANTAPGVVWGTVPSVVRGDTVISFVVADTESDPLSVVVQYNAGAGWKAATFNPVLPGSLASSMSGTEYQLTWASATDIMDDVSGVQLRVQVDDSYAKSPWIGSTTFDVQNRPGSSTGIVISEIGAGTENWFELENVGTDTYDLRSWKLKYTAEPYGWTYAFPDTTTQTTPITLAPGTRLLVTSNSGTTTSTTVYLGYNFGWQIGASGSLELQNDVDVPIDFVRWGGSPATPTAGTGWSEPKVVYIPNDGAALKRKTTADHDSSSDFCAAPATKGAANTSSCYPEASATSKLHFVEVSAGADNPTPSFSDAPQWVELLNSGTSVDLTNWVLTTTSAKGTKRYLLRTVQVGSSGRLQVRSASSGFDSTGLQYAGAQAFSLTPGSAGAVWISDPSGKPIDFVRWGGSSVEPPSPMTFTETTPLIATDFQVSLSRQMESTTNQSADSWCTTLPTPAAASGACFTPPTPQIVINEVATGSVGGFINPTFAFIEIRNAGTGYVAVEGWQLRWGGTGSSSTWTIADTTPMAPGERRAYYECGVYGTAPSPCSGSLPWGQLGSNTAGYVELVDSGATPKSMDFMRWGTATATPSGSGGAWTEPAALPALSGSSGVRSFGRTEGNSDTNKSTDFCFQNATAGTLNGICR